MDKKCPPLLADLIFFYFTIKYFMFSLSDDNQADVIETFKSTFRYLDFDINYPYFKGMVNQRISHGLYGGLPTKRLDCYLKEI